MLTLKYQLTISSDENQQEKLCQSNFMLTQLKKLINRCISVHPSIHPSTHLSFNFCLISFLNPWLAAQQNHTHFRKYICSYRSECQTQMSDLPADNSKRKPSLAKNVHQMLSAKNKNPKMYVWICLLSTLLLSPLLKSMSYSPQWEKHWWRENIENIPKGNWKLWWGDRKRKKLAPC